MKLKPIHFILGGIGAVVLASILGRKEIMKTIKGEKIFEKKTFKSFEEAKKYTREHPELSQKLKEAIKSIAKDKKDFIKQVEKIAKEIGKKYDIDYKILIAQAGHETGWGTKVIDNNLFNIKGEYKGEYVEVPVGEYDKIGGFWYITMAKFRKYPSIKESFEDYIELISKKPNYKKAWENRKNYKKYFEELVKGGYATDPKYADSLIKTYEVV